MIAAAHPLGACIALAVILAFTFGAPMLFLFWTVARPSQP